jgi:predicted DNA binding CopG/RHH family protein
MAEETFEKKTKSIILRVPSRIKDAIREKAKKEKKDESKIVRDAIEKDLKKK